MKENDNRNILMSVSYDNKDGKYYVSLAPGSSVNETAFGVSVIIKCLVRDGIIKDGQAFTDLVIKYFNDPQYKEIKK